MAERCFMCGRAATAGGNSHIAHRAKCIRCTSLTHIEIPMSGERMGQVPDSIVEGPAWPLAAGIARGKFLWLHQAEGLSELDAGQNIVVATSTASGKTMIFQLWTMNEIQTNPGATALIFYPTKALANDQARRWQETCRAVGLNPETVGQIDGDVRGNDRDTIINRARIIIATPDVTHAWMLRRTNDHSIRRFLQNLRVIVIDEAHTYEGIFGSNAAYLMRRLTSASLVCGAAEAPRFIAATATIQTPGEHLEKLTGRCFSIIGEERNGSPRFHRDLYHMPMSSGRTSAEDQLAQLVLGIINNDDEAQVIAFHDSRMGVERIVQRINRKESVLPYRSGYLAQDRRALEEKLRNNTIRGVIATSALELGIDMPDLNYGIQLNLPPSRKQFHQRLGRVGRSKPGVFVLLARQNQFSNYGETLQDYYDNSVEPSHLYLDNEYINYQQALCLKDELERNRRDTRTPPSHITWPSLFPDSLRNAHGRPPRHLQNPSMMGDTPPQIANSLRSCGEETLQIILLEEGQPERNIGQINIHAALNEAYPGGVYRHQGVSYHVVEWGRRRGEPEGLHPGTGAVRNGQADQPDVTANGDLVSRSHHDDAAAGDGRWGRDRAQDHDNGVRRGIRVQRRAEGPVPGRVQEGPQAEPEAEGDTDNGRADTDQQALVRRRQRRPLAGPPSNSAGPAAAPGIPAQHRAARHRVPRGEHLPGDPAGVRGAGGLHTGPRQHSRRAGTGQRPPAEPGPVCPEPGRRHLRRTRDRLPPARRGHDPLG